MKRILITGAAGRIGTVLRAGLRGHVPVIRLTDRVPMGEAEEHEEIVLADLADYDAVEACMRDVDAVIHLGAIPDEAAFSAILRDNITATYHVFEAAKNQGVRRVVFASSIHAVGFYPRDRKIDGAVPVRPDTYYGVSKVFGESLGSMYADKYGLEVISVRICSFAERPQDVRHLSTWLSPRDAVQLFLTCLNAPVDGPAIVYGVSANTRSWFDNSRAYAMGYQPQDDAELYAQEIEQQTPPADPADPAERYMGGVFVRRDFRGLQG